MQYFIFPIILLVYFEFLGRYILTKFKRQVFEFSFVYGFIILMAYMFVFTSFISAFHLPFYVLYLFVVAFVFISSFLIIKDFKKLNLQFNYKLWLIVILTVSFIGYLSYHRTLGEVHGFDTLFYLNIVSDNINASALNVIHPHFGLKDIGYIRADYTFQAFYNFASVSIYSFRLVLRLFNLSFETMPAFVWGFQILLSFFFVATTLNCLQALKIKNMYLKLAMMIIFNLFMANLYYNNVYGFIGNNHRMYILATACIFIFDYFKTNKQNDLYLFYLSLLGLSGVSSTGSFSALFFLFGLFFVLVDSQKDLIKHYSIVLFIPLCNIICTKFKTSLLLVGFCLGLMIILWFLNDYLISIYRHFKVKIITVLIFSLFFMVMSYLITGNLLDFNAFFHNYSEIADMSFDYFMFNDLRHYIFNSIVLLTMTYYLIKNYQKPMGTSFLIIILVFFSPFNVTFINKINWVYYRAYDIIINQYTLSLFVYYFYQQFSFKKIYITIILSSSLFLAYLQIPIYYHPSFIPDENYDFLYKISKDELNIIRNIRQLIKDKGLKKPAIITDTFYMYSYLEDSSYLFGKEKRYNYLKPSKANYNLFVSLFPYDYIYDNFKPQDVEADFINLNQDLKDSSYDLLIIKYATVYQDQKTSKHRHLFELISEKFEVSPYSNDKYAVFILK